MSQPTISILIPTAGRDTLPYVMQTISQQALVEGDEVLIIGDGAQKEVEAQVEAIGPPFRYVQGPHTNDWGHSQLNLGIGLAKGDWLAFTDDDDGYLPRAIETVREVIAKKAYSPHIFRFYTNDRHLVWRSRDNGSIEETLVGGHNLVIPNHAGKVGEGAWTDRYRGDLDYVRAVLDSYPRRDWQWRPEILTRQRPDRTLAWWSVRTPEQFEALRVLRNECRADMTHNQAEISAAEQTEFAKKVSLGGMWPMLFSVREEQPFAYCGWALVREIEGKKWVSYGVGEKFRGRGLARAIFQFTADSCMADAYADVAETNAASLHVHQELGWAETKREDGLVFLKKAYPAI